MKKDLRSHLQTVRKAGADYFREVKAVVQPDFDISVIQNKLALRSEFPTLYFPDVIGYQMPVVSSLFGNYQSLGLALDLSIDEIQSTGNAVILNQYLKRKSTPIPFKEIDPGNAPVREVTFTGDDVDLGALPIPRHAEHNGGRYLSIGVTVIRDPESGVTNAGIYRQMITGKNTLTCMSVASHDGARIIRQHQDLGKKVEMATFIGHHPAVLMGAAYPLSPEASEYDYIGGLLNEPLAVVKGLTVDVPVPAWAEIVIEGRIDPGKQVQEGPFSEALGFYDAGKPCFEIEVTAITRRQDAIFHNLCPLHQEHLQVNILGRESKLLEATRDVVPGVKAVHLGPEDLVGKGLCFISIQKSSAEDIEKVVEAALSADKFCKYLFIVDDDVDVYHQSEVLWALASITKNEPAIRARPGKMMTTHIIDATRDLGKTYADRCSPPRDRWNAVRLEDCF